MFSGDKFKLLPRYKNIASNWGKRQCPFCQNLKNWYLLNGLSEISKQSYLLDTEWQHFLDPSFGGFCVLLVASFQFLSALGPIFKFLYFLSRNCFICLLQGL